MLRWTLLAALVVAGCDESSDSNFESSGTTTTKPKAGGFSADLAKTLGSGSDGKGAVDSSKDGSKDTVKDPKDGAKAAQDASKDSTNGVAKDGSKDAAKDGSKDVAKDGSKDAAKDGSKDVSKDAAKDGSKDVVKDGSKDAAKDLTKTVAKDGSKDAAKDGSKDTAKEAAKAGSKDVGKDGSKDAGKDGSKDVAKDGGPAVKSVPVNLAAPRVPVKPSAELAAIRLSLEPNWDRDVGEAGTISLVVKVPGKDETRVFAFRYGYEDAKAPTDREAYKKWLEDNKILKPSLDRQRGPAWYLEGQDGNGAPAFRIVVTYGGKKLVCGGSLYKDAASNQLGDIRDKTLIQAKEICETLQL